MCWGTDRDHQSSAASAISPLHSLHILNKMPSIHTSPHKDRQGRGTLINVEMGKALLCWSAGVNLLAGLHFAATLAVTVCQLPARRSKGS